MGLHGPGKPGWRLLGKENPAYLKDCVAKALLGFRILGWRCFSKGRGGLLLRGWSRSVRGDLCRVGLHFHGGVGCARGLRYHFALGSDRVDMPPVEDPAIGATTPAEPLFHGDVVQASGRSGEDGDIESLLRVRATMKELRMVTFTRSGAARLRGGTWLSNPVRLLGRFV